jgi:uncharacterized protein YgiM (DUF1202 family)
MKTRLMTLVKGAAAVLAILAIIQLSQAQDISRAAGTDHTERQTVPTRTPTPTPIPPSPTVTETPISPSPTPTTIAPTPTTVPPTPTDTPAPAPRTPTPAPPQPPATATPVPPPVTINVNSNTDVYNGPGVGYPVIGALEAGSTVTVVGRNGNSTWWQISFGNGRGWIPDTAVNAGQAAHSVPVVSVPASDSGTSEPQTLPQAGGTTWVLSAGLALLMTGAFVLIAGTRVYKNS